MEQKTTVPSYARVCIEGASRKQRGDDYMSEETITISLKKYKRLLKDSEWLGYLEAAGIDNTQAYEHACDMRREDNPGDDEDDE